MIEYDLNDVSLVDQAAARYTRIRFDCNFLGGPLIASSLGTLARSSG